EILSRVFEPFFTTKEVGKGTGLGLSMVYGFVKQSGGHAKIYSEAGFGTAVKIYLPPRRPPEQAQAAPPAEATAPGTFSGSILLVEDDPLVQATVAAKLRRMGYEVTVAGTGMEAIDAVADNPRFDLVFSDVVMPGPMTGADLAREIPKRWPEIKILLTSGYTAAASLGKIQIPPDIKLLSKPYSNTDLSAAVREALET
ncbi:MAG: response regulator, partial [Rhodospirillaceae bacterium]